VEGLELGAEYRSLGRRLERVVREAPSRRDKEGSEVGVARRMGMLRLRLSQSELSDALLGNGLRPLGAAFASKAAPLRPIPGTRTLSHPPGRARVQGRRVASACMPLRIGPGMSLLRFRVGSPGVPFERATMTV